jgi:hypothetical protein
MGLIWYGIFVLTFFLCWLFLIVLCYCLGPRRVGFFSGQPFTKRLYYQDGDDIVPLGINPNNSVGFSDSIVFTDERLHLASRPSSYDDPTETRRTADEENENEPAYKNPLGLSNSTLSFNKNKIQSRPLQTNVSSVMDSTSADVHQQHYNHQAIPMKIGRQYNDYTMWIRILFILAGMAFVTSACLLVTKGITNLQRNVDTLSVSSQAVANLTRDSSIILESRVLRIQNDVSLLRQTLEHELEQERFCPGLPIDISDEPVIVQIRSIVNQTLFYMQKIDYVDETINITDLLRSLRKSSDSAHDIHRTTSGIKITDWESLLVLIPCTIVPTLVIASAIMASFDVRFVWYYSVVVWFIFPIFIMIVLFAAILSAILMMSTTSNADFCSPTLYQENPTSLIPMPLSSSTILLFNNEQQQEQIFQSLINSPDVTILHMAQKYGMDTNTLEYRIVAFYITQCGLSNPFDGLLRYIPDIVSNVIFSITGVDMMQQLVPNKAQTLGVWNFLFKGRKDCFFCFHFNKRRVWSAHIFYNFVSYCFFVFRRKD